MIDRPTLTYVFVIDTEQYAGNFERELTAYCTGRFGDCGNGKDLAKVFYQDMGLIVGDESAPSLESWEDLRNPFDCIVNERDDHGTMRPTSIWSTPGWFNHGMGGHFRHGQEAEALVDYRKECRKYGDTQYYRNDPEAQERHRKEWYDKGEKPLHKCPSYQSVAIFMGRVPTDEQVALITQRAAKYNDYIKTTESARYGPPHSTSITITGYRLLEQRTIESELQKWPS